MRHNRHKVRLWNQKFNFPNKSSLNDMVQKWFCVFLTRMFGNGLKAENAQRLYNNLRMKACIFRAVRKVIGVLLKYRRFWNITQKKMDMNRHIWSDDPLTRIRAKSVKNLSAISLSLTPATLQPRDHLEWSWRLISDRKKGVRGS